MGMDATKPLDADEMKFKRIRVPGEDKIDLAKAVRPVPAASWRKALGR
jgi:2,5-furandicarboxylate decarboxylase 1